MALVGDVILRARSRGGDPCQGMLQPFAPTIVASGAGGITGTIYGVLTWLNAFGETIGAPEVSITGLSNNQITLTSAPPVAATSGRFYYSTFSGRQQHYEQLGITGTDIVGEASAVQYPGLPPLQPSALIPDTDGEIVSAFEMYRWLNAGLAQLGNAAGGILDQIGLVASTSQSSFLLLGHWVSIDYVWYNGWLALPKPQSFFWQQSEISGSPSITTIWQNANSQILGLWPQPQNAGNSVSSTLLNPMTTGQLAANLVSNVGFVAPGLVQIENEILGFDNTPGSVGLSNMVRGQGGTVAAAHAAGVTVTQCNVRLVGRRFPVIYNVGNAGLTLDIPRGWDPLLDLYMLAQYREVQGNVTEAITLMEQFMASAGDLRPSEEDELPAQLSNRQLRDGFLPSSGFALPRLRPQAWIRPRPEAPEAKQIGARKRGGA